MIVADYRTGVLLTSGALGLDAETVPLQLGVVRQIIARRGQSAYSAIEAGAVTPSAFTRRSRMRALRPS
jgi:hypothetical protein